MHAITPSRRLAVVLLVSCWAPQAGVATASEHGAFARLVERGERLDDADVRALVRRSGGTPVIEGEDAIFLVEGRESPPRLVGDFNDWGEGAQEGPAGALERLGSTRFFFGRVRLHPAARVEYRFVVDGSEEVDPLNPRTVAAFEGRHSEVRMPGYAPLIDFEDDPATPRGRVETFEHTSASLFNSRRVHVYLPPGYDGSQSRQFPVAWFNDGSLYVERVGVVRILDALIARRRIEPLIAVLVDPVVRRTEYAGNAAFRAMMVDELVPLIDKRFRTDVRAERRLIAGGSRGGMAALDLALAKPATFGLCAAWAPALSPTPVRAFLDQRRSSSSRFALIRHLYDDRWGADALALCEGLRSRGAAVDYAEVPEGHTLGAWPGRVVEVLTALMPARQADVARGARRLRDE